MDKILYDAVHNVVSAVSKHCERCSYVNANECIECKYRSMVCIFIDSGVTNTKTYTDHATTLYVAIGRICATYAMRQGAYLPDRFFRGTRRRF